MLQRNTNKPLVNIKKALANASNEKHDKEFNVSFFIETDIYFHEKEPQIQLW